MKYARAAAALAAAAAGAVIAHVWLTAGPTWALLPAAGAAAWAAWDLSRG